MNKESVRMKLANLASAIRGVATIVENFREEVVDTPQASSPYASGRPTAEFWQSVKEKALSGEKIWAIKEIRDVTGLGLSESKTIVDKWTGMLQYTPWSERNPTFPSTLPRP